MKSTVSRCVLAALACLPASLASAQDPIRAEVVHAYTGGGDALAVAALAKAFNEAGGLWVDTAIGGFANAQAAGLNRTIAGDAPAAIHYGMSLDVAGLVADGLLNNVDAVAEAGNWDELVLQVFQPTLHIDGHWYAVPMNVQGVNFLWYSLDALRKVGVETPPTDWEGFFDTLAKLKAAGMVPLASGGLSYLEQHVFNFVLLQRGGPELYLAFYRDGDVDAVRSPAFLDVMQTYARLREYGDPNSPGRGWDTTVALLINGEAGFHVSGEWVKPAFLGAGLTLGKEFGCSVSFGDVPLIIGGDVLAFPRTDDPAVIAGQHKLAEVVFSPEAQKIFNDTKGSYPVRVGVESGMTDICAQQAIAKFTAQEVIAAGDVFITPERKGAIRDAITTFWNTASATPEAGVEAFAAALAE